MLRVIHNQTVVGGIIVDDIDDGLPNKEVHRLGSTADPKQYARDGYAGKSKQACYIPYSHTATNGTVTAGYITLNQTDRVIMSGGKGKISKLATAGLVTVVSTTAANLVAPVVTACPHATPVIVTGTTLTSVAPDTTVVTFAQGTGGTAPSPLSFTQAQILAASGGSVSATSIHLPASLFTTAPVAGNTVTVLANEQTSNTFTLT